MCVQLYNDTKLTITHTYALMQAICYVVRGVSVNATRKCTSSNSISFQQKEYFVCQTISHANTKFIYSYVSFIRYSMIRSFRDTHVLCGNHLDTMCNKVSR